MERPVEFKAERKADVKNEEEETNRDLFSLLGGEDEMTHAPVEVEANGVFTIKGGANRITDCALANETLSAALLTSNSVFSLKEAVSILGGIETDFSCASLCSHSPFYTFSSVGRGPPPTSCRKSVASFMTHLSGVFLWSSLLFGLITLTGLVFSVMITLEKRRDVEEPLLQR